MSQTWQEKRHQEAAARSQLKQQRRQLLVAQMTPEELTAYDEVHVQFKKQKVDERRRLVELQRKRLENRPYLAVDLNFYDLMTEKEVRSLRQQLMYCYSISLHSETPLQLALYGYNNDILQLSRVEGFDNWRCFKTSQDLSQALGTANFVYLSGDAEETLTAFEQGVTYVIGGLVDRNRHKNVALDRARALGIRAVKIDIQALQKLKTSQILAVNHIFDIMTRLQSESLEDAVVHSVPSRKMESE